MRTLTFSVDVCFLFRFSKRCGFLNKHNITIASHRPATGHGLSYLIFFFVILPWIILAKQVERGVNGPLPTTSHPPWKISHRQNVYLANIYLFFSAWTFQIYMIAIKSTVRRMEFIGFTDLYISRVISVVLIVCAVLARGVLA